ncbi:hypothetical protein D3C84_703550 [compost metagenome]
MTMFSLALGQVPILLCRVVCMQPPLVFVELVAVFAGAVDDKRRRTLVGITPSVVHDKTVSQAAEFVPLQVDRVLDQRVVGQCFFVLISDAFQGQKL